MNPALLPFNTQTEPEKLDLAYYKKRASMLRAQSVNRKVQVEQLSHEEVQGTIGASRLSIWDGFLSYLAFVSIPV
jgi:hypothetical protein